MGTYEFTMVAKLDKSRDVGISNDYDISAAASIATIWTSVRHELFVATANESVTAVTG